jgi:hypothetical protein
MNRNLIIIVGIFIAIIVTLLTGNIIIIGDKIGRLTHVYVEYSLYAFLFVLSVIYIIRPILKVHNAPEFPVLSIGNMSNVNQLKIFAKRLADNCDYIPDKKLRKKHRNELLSNIRFHSAELEPLKVIISKEIALRMEGSKELNVLGIDNRIKEWSKTVFMITAMSQNSKFDTIAVLVMNYRLIADIVLASGFRPTKPQLFKLYVKVLTTALVTYCTSQVFTDVDGVAPFDFGDDISAGESIDNVTDAEVDIDVEDVDTDSSGVTGIFESLRKIRIPGIVVGSLADGSVNALMTLRIGYVTKLYLTEGANSLSGSHNKRKIKRQALKESIKVLPAVLASGSKSLGKGVANMMTKIVKSEIA